MPTTKICRSAMKSESYNLAWWTIYIAVFGKASKSLFLLPHVLDGGGMYSDVPMFSKPIHRSPLTTWWGAPGGCKERTSVRYMNMRAKMPPSATNMNLHNGCTDLRIKVKQLVKKLTNKISRIWVQTLDPEVVWKLPSTAKCGEMANMENFPKRTILPIFLLQCRAGWR